LLRQVAREQRRWGADIFRALGPEPELDADPHPHPLQPAETPETEVGEAEGTEPKHQAVHAPPDPDPHVDTDANANADAASAAKDADGDATLLRAALTCLGLDERAYYGSAGAAAGACPCSASSPAAPSNSNSSKVLHPVEAWVGSGRLLLRHVRPRLLAPRVCVCACRLACAPNDAGVVPAVAARNRAAASSPRLSGRLCFCDHAQLGSFLA
jgi:hypothetical protein